MTGIGEPFSRLREYVAQLPDGLDSYPDCVAKGSIARLALREFEWREVYETLPEPLREGLRHRPLPSAWLPEVHSVALHMAAADAEGLSMEDVLRWSHESNTRLAESPMYRIVAAVASPAILLRTAALSWRLLHRGVSLSIESQASGRTEAAIEHPPHLWNELVHLSTAQGLRAAVEAAGGREVRAELADYVPERGRYVLTWS